MDTKLQFNWCFPDNDFENNCLLEIKKLVNVPYCTMINTKQLLNFSRKELFDYFDYEASILNL